MLGSEAQFPKPVSSTYEYLLYGGYAGSKEHIVVDSLGQAEVDYTFTPNSSTERYAYLLTKDRVDSLKVAFERSHFFWLDSSYEAETRIMDGFNCRVTWSLPSGSRTVWIEANASVPSRLADILVLFNKLSSEIRSNGQKL